MRPKGLLLSILLPSLSAAFGGWGPMQSGSPKKDVSKSLQVATVNGQDIEENITTLDLLSLDSIRSTLIRQEETIIFALIERAQFRCNNLVYKKGGFGNLGIPIGSEDVDSGEELSFMEYMLIGTEALHHRLRRYASPEEHAFFPERLPKGPVGPLPPLDYPQDLLSAEGGAIFLNFNKRLLEKYIDIIVPSISSRGDDEQHGSAVLCDIAVLQALSRRVHYGKFVAESKYRSDPEAYQKLVDNDDADGVMELLTNAEVEAQVLRRARLKAATYGTEPVLSGCHDGTAETQLVASAAAAAVVATLQGMDEAQMEREGKIDPAVIESIYRDIVIPMTKDIEVAYLFLRCGKQPPPEYAA